MHKLTTKLMVAHNTFTVEEESPTPGGSANGVGNDAHHVMWQHIDGKNTSQKGKQVVVPIGFYDWCAHLFSF